MADSVANLLLRITGDSDDGEDTLGKMAAGLQAFDKTDAEATATVDADRRDLDRLQRDLTEFGRDVATAEADVDIRQARANVGELQAVLKRVDLTEASPDVIARTGQAQAKLTALKVMIEKLDNDDIDIDVNIKSDLSGMLLAVGSQAGKLSGVLGEASEAAAEAGGSIGKMGITAGTAGISLGGMGGPILAIAGLLIGALLIALTAVIAALTAMVASLGAALVALGALGIAFGGVVVAAGVFGLAVAQGLKQGGPIAQQLKKQVKDLGAAFRETAGDGVKAFLGQVGPAIKTIIPAIRGLKSGFTAFGTAAGQAVTRLAEGFTQLAPKFNKLLKGSAGALAPLTRIFVALGHILLNIANAVMPFLISGLRQVASTLEGWSRGTDNASALNGVIETIMGHLKSWLNLLNEIGDIFTELFQATASQGKSLVDQLAAGAGALADWIENNPKAIKDFFNDVLPLAKSFGRFLAVAVLLLIKMTQAAAPTLTKIFDIFTNILGLLAKFPNLTTAAVAGFLAWKGPIALARKALDGVASTLGNIIKNAAKKILIRTAATTATTVGADVAGGAAGGAAAKAAGAGAGGGFLASFLAKLKGIGPAIAGVFRSAGGVLLGAGRFLVGPIIAAVTGLAAAIGAPVAVVVAVIAGIIAVGVLIVTQWKHVKGALGAVWNGIKSLASAVWNGIRTAVSAAARATVGVVKALWNGAKTSLGTIWNGIKSTALTVWNGIKTVVTTAVRALAGVVRTVLGALKTAVGTIWNAMKGTATTVWNAIKTAVTRGAQAAASVAKSVFNGLKGALAGIWNAIKSAVSSAWNTVKEKISGAVKGALAAVKGIAGSFFNAGRALVQKIIDGITSMARTARDAVGGLADGLVDMLPGSEPKDPRSPLRGLSDRGKAIVDNMIAGIQASRGQLANALNGQLSVAGLPKVPLASSKLAAQGVGLGSTTTHNEYNLNAVERDGYGAESDARSMLIALEDQLRVRGGIRSV